jgi:hypothetical protein
MKRGVGRSLVLKLALGGVFICIIIFVLPFLFKDGYSASFGGSATNTVEVLKPVVKHMETPDAVKGIYMTACVAGTPSWRTQLKKFIEDTELNAVVIDIKDFSGTISFIHPDFPQPDATGCRVVDMKEFVAELHNVNIYVIGRITVFQDPYYTKLHPEFAVKKKSDGGVWRDHKRLSFIDVGARPYWDHVIALSKTSYELGFDELNFDYIRYPSDGNMKDTNYTWTVGTSTKPEMLKGFFSYLHDGLEGVGVKTSADLFGMTTTNKDDLGIGQILENALLYFDYVDPMVYPSHYPATWNGIANPAAKPYEVIKLAMQGGVDKALALASSTPGLDPQKMVQKLRPWLQDFDLGATYGVAEVQAQIKATYEVGLTSWLVWDAGNRYTREAYFLEQ